VLWESTADVTCCCICIPKQAGSILSAHHNTLKCITKTYGSEKCYFRRVRATAREAKLYVIQTVALVASVHTNCASHAARS